MIYFSDDNFSKISVEENASKLVNQLLDDYFKKYSDPQEVSSEKKKELEALRLEILELDNQAEERRKRLVANFKEIKKKPEERLTRQKEYEKYLIDNKLDFQKYTFTKYQEEHPI